tara:strand:- start:727 stop:954 length:228 start_codon:yes stop_codon:yes gene_type:complete
MKIAGILLVAVLGSCTTVEGVMEAEALYCNEFYKGIRAVGRGALSATTGVIVPDVCDTIDVIVEDDASSVGKSDS